jgi:hypothetical protein
MNDKNILNPKVFLGLFDPLLTRSLTLLFAK